MVSIPHRQGTTEFNKGFYGYEISEKCQFLIGKVHRTEVQERIIKKPDTLFVSIPHRQGTTLVIAMNYSFMLLVCVNSS